MIILEIVISILTVAREIMLGSRSRLGWTLSIVNQVLWLALIIWSKHWGLLPLNVMMWITSIRGYVLWKQAQ